MRHLLIILSLFTLYFSQQIFYDNFDNGILNDSWEIRGDISVTFESGYSGYGLQIDGKSEHGQGLIGTFNNSSPTYVSFYINPTLDRLYSHAYFVLAGPNGRSIFFYISDYYCSPRTFTVSSEDGVSFCYDQDLVDDWYFIEFRNINFTTNRFDWYVNEELIATQIPFKDDFDNVNTVSWLDLYNYTDDWNEENISLYDEICIIEGDYCGECNVFDECGQCGGSGVDEDEDGICDDIDECIDVDTDDICDDVDDCIGEYDQCGVCNGDGVDEDEDGICDDIDDCVGTYDECGVCNGDGIADGVCDCDGNVEDCNGDCGGDAVVDDCGICDGANTDQDCNGHCFGESQIDNCEECYCPQNIIDDYGPGICIDTNFDNEPDTCEGGYYDGLEDDCNMCSHNGWASEEFPCGYWGRCESIINPELDEEGQNGLDEYCANFDVNNDDDFNQCQDHPYCIYIHDPLEENFAMDECGECGGDNDCLEIEELPAIFGLNAPYPNPFNPIITIGYDVSSISNVNISIYNTNGQLVDVLADKMYKPGKYSIVWNAQDYTSGVYIVKLIAGEFVDTQKMMLIK